MPARLEADHDAPAAETLAIVLPALRDRHSVPLDSTTRLGTPPYVPGTISSATPTGPGSIERPSLRTVSRAAHWQ